MLQRRSPATNKRAIIIIGGLVAAILGLGITLDAVLATDDGDDTSGDPYGVAAGDEFMGMMDTMGDLDSGTLVEHMRDVHGEDGVGRMLGHMREHGDGGPMTGDPTIHDMTHRMMDGMMEHMRTEGGVMSGDPDTHHQTPAPRRTPGPGGRELSPWDMH